MTPAIALQHSTSWFPREAVLVDAFPYSAALGGAINHNHLVSAFGVNCGSTIDACSTCFTTGISLSIMFTMFRIIHNLSHRSQSSHRFTCNVFRNLSNVHNFSTLFTTCRNIYMFHNVPAALSIFHNFPNVHNFPISEIWCTYFMISIMFAIVAIFTCFTFCLPFCTYFKICQLFANSCHIRNLSHRS